MFAVQDTSDFGLERLDCPVCCPYLHVSIQKSEVALYRTLLPVVLSLQICLLLSEKSMR
jgi:hypothetical protein